MTVGAGLASVASPAHRAIAALMLGGAPQDRIIVDLRASDPVALARIAEAHYVDTAIAPVLTPPMRRVIPEDLGIFFDEMHAANTRRNSRLLVQLRSVAEALRLAGIPAVALKGAAELAAPMGRPLGARYLSDIDILVAPAKIAEAGEVLKRMGAEADRAALPGHHHEAGLSAAEWVADVELHRALGRGPAFAALAPDGVLSRAEPSTIPGLLVPCARDRVLHLALHAQVSNAGLEERRFTLRDLSDLRQLADQMPDGIAGEDEGLDALLAALAALSGRENPFQSNAQAQDWARAAIAQFDDLARQRQRAAGVWIRRLLREVWRDPVRRRDILDRALKPTTLREAIGTLRARLALFR